MSVILLHTLLSSLLSMSFGAQSGFSVSPGSLYRIELPPKTWRSIPSKKLFGKKVIFLQYIPSKELFGTLITEFHSVPSSEKSSKEKILKDQCTKLAEFTQSQMQPAKIGKDDACKMVRNQTSKQASESLVWLEELPAMKNGKGTISAKRIFKFYSLNFEYPTGKKYEEAVQVALQGVKR